VPSTYSTNLAIELIGNNDQAGTWGNTTNTNLGTLIEQAISGYVTQAVATGTDTTITIPNGATGVARNMYIELTGTGGTNTNLIVPANKKLYFIYNNTSSGQVTVKVSGQTGVSVPNGKKMVLVSNGTDIVTAENYVASLSTDNLSLTGSLTLSGGTANGVLYLNGSKVATSGSALVFNGTALTNAGQIGCSHTTADSVAAYFYNLSATGYGPLYRGGGGTGRYIGQFLKYDGSDAMILDASGNLGIGTSSPATKLEVYGDGTIKNSGVPSLNMYRDVSLDVFTNEGWLNFGGRFNSTTYATGARIGAITEGSAWSASNYGSALFFSTTPSGSTTLTERARIDAAGNFGLGVAPSGWFTDYRVMQVGLAGAVFNDNFNEDLNVSSNSYADTRGGYKFIRTGYAQRYTQTNSGQHQWRTSTASGTAGNAITFTQAMTLDASSNLMVGDTTASGRLTVKRSTDGTIGYFDGSTTQFRIDVASSTINLNAQNGNGVMAFQTNSTERARIDSAGRFLLNLTAGSYLFQSTVTSGADREMFLSGVTGLTNGVYWRWVNSSSTIDFRVGSLPTTASAANAFLDSAADNQLYRSTSSIRYKKDVESIDQSYADNALNLRPIWYRSKAPNDNAKWSWYGLISEEVAEIDPRLVHWTYPDEAYEIEEVDGAISKSLKPDAQMIPDGVQYERLSVLLLDIVKRQKIRLEQLEAKVAALESK
jgi:hypothetical protein